MGTTTLDTLETRLSQNIGDWLEVDTTTTIAAGVSIISTELKSYDQGMDDYFNNWWVWITEGNNIGKERQVADYATATGTLTVRGTNLTLEDGAVTIRVYRYSRANKIRAINNAIRSIYPTLYHAIDDLTLITDNILPNAHFEDWAVTANPDFWAVVGVGASAAVETTIIRQGTKSAKLTRVGADCYLRCGNVDYMRLLDLQDKTVDFKCWVWASVADRAYIEVYTKKADGTEQTLTSSAHSGSSEWELLKLEDKALNDDLTDIEFRVKVITANTLAYFDAARVTGRGVTELLLPNVFQTGNVERVYIQTNGYSDDICDDLHPTDWEAIWGWAFIHRDYKYLNLFDSYEANRQIRLRGIAPLESVSSATNTVSIDSPKVDLLVARAKIELFQILKATPASQDIGRYNDSLADAWREYKDLEPRHRMGRRVHPNLPVY